MSALVLVVVLYPFFFHREDWDISESKSSPQNLDTRWENALAGIRNTELEHAIGSLSEKDYQVLKTIGDYFQKVSEKQFSLADIIRYLSDHPEVSNLNRSEHRKYWDRGVKKSFEG